MALDKLVDSAQLDAGLASVAGAIRTKGGTSAQLQFPAGFVSAVEAIPTGGGGGAQTIATGTFTGDGSGNAFIPIGKTMPECDFVFSLWVPSGTEVTSPAVVTNRSYVYVQVLVQKRFQKFDLSTNGTKNTIGQCTYPVVNSEAGTTTNRTPNLNIAQGAFVRYSVTPSAEAINALKIIRDASGFVLSLGKNNQYTFLTGVDYNWEIIYFGSDPNNDIVEVA